MLIKQLQEMNENAESKMVTIKGFGQITIDQAKKNAISRMEKALSSAKSGSWSNASSTLFGDGVLKELISAIESYKE